MNRTAEAVALRLAQVSDILTSEGLAEFFACFDPLRPHPGRWRAARAELTGTLGALVDLCLLGEAVPLANLPAGLRRQAAELERCGLWAITTDGEAHLCGRVLLAPLGLWLVCDPPQANPRLYFGDDSMALLARSLPSVRPGRCLDLCAGTGLLALHACRFQHRVIAVESDAEACRLARLNAALNNVTDRLEVREGDLYDRVADERFDWIVANPPCLPYPEDLPSPLIGHGGPDGLGLTRPILSGLADRLTDHGEAQLIGLALSDGGSPRSVLALADLMGRRQFDCTVSIVSRTSLEPNLPFYALLTRAISQATSTDPDRVAAAYADLLARQGASHLCRYFLRVRRGTGRLTLIDLARDGESTSWFD